MDRANRFAGVGGGSARGDARDAGGTCRSGKAGGRHQFDVIIRNGTVYDGTGAAGVKADVGILLDRIAAVGDLGGATAATIVDANGLAVAPGFINMLSWSTESLLVDGRAQGGIRAGRHHRDHG